MKLPPRLSLVALLAVPVGMVLASGPAIQPVQSHSIRPVAVTESKTVPTHWYYDSGSV